MTEPVPRRVDGPIAQIHEARPSWPVVLAAAGPWPCAVLLVPSGVVYWTEQLVPGSVWTVTEADPPAVPPLTALNVTLCPLGGAAVAGAGCGVDTLVG
jgi:hypothetical protein